MDRVHAVLTTWARTSGSRRLDELKIELNELGVHEPEDLDCLEEADILSSISVCCITLNYLEPC
jgi:hypothetical protein